MITGRLAEALVRRARAGRPVEREGRARRDQLPVDEVRDELHVVDAVRVAAVDRLVAADTRRDPHRAGLCRRAVRLFVYDDDPRGAVGRREGRAEDVAAGRERAHDAAGARRDDDHAAARERAEGRVARTLVDAAAELAEVARRAGAADAQGAGPVARKREDRGQLALREPPRGDAELHPHRAGERRAHLRRDGHEVGGAHARLVDPDGEREAAALEAGERVDDRVARGRTVEHVAGPRRHDDRLQPPQHERCVAVRAVDGPAHASELVGECLVEHLRGRRDVRAEDADADPAEAADRGEPVALVEREPHGRVPVRLDAEAARPQPPLMAGGREDDRHLGERDRARLELRPCLGSRQPADVDAVDADPGCDPVGRPGEHESEHDAADHSDDRQHDQPLNEQRPGTTAASATDPDRSASRLDAQG